MCSGLGQKNTLRMQKQLWMRGQCSNLLVDFPQKCKDYGTIKTLFVWRSWLARHSNIGATNGIILSYMWPTNGRLFRKLVWKQSLFLQFRYSVTCGNLESATHTSITLSIEFDSDTFQKPTTHKTSFHFLTNFLGSIYSYTQKQLNATD